MPERTARESEPRPRTLGAPIDPAARLSAGYLAVIVGLTVLTHGFPVPEVLADAVYSGIGLSVAIAILVGVRRYRPRAPIAWYLMAAAQWMWVVGDTAYNWQRDVLGRPAFPSIADLFYLLGYPTFAVALILLLRGRTRRGLGPTLDSAIVITGLALLVWVVLAKPTLVSLNEQPAAAVVATAYPVMDILLIGALVRLLSSPGGRSPAFRMLLVALGLLIAADTISAALDLFSTNTVGPVEWLWLLSYAAWGAAALHPSMTALSEPAGHREAPLRGRRLTMVLMTTMVPPAILAVHQVTGASVDLWAVIAGSVVILPLVLVRMNLAIREIAAAHDALEHLQDEMAVLATHDSLTGLANRAQTMRLVASALGRASRHQTRVAVLFADLDGFKKVNDEHGHRAGDQVLREVARRMEQEIRAGDFVGRLGGDEFLIGIENLTDEEGALALAGRLIRSVAEPIALHDDEVATVGLSIGIALGQGGRTDVESLVHEADLAVYQAKASGRGSVEIFGGQARADLKQRQEIERALTKAIREDELLLHFQPIVHLATGRTECYEALVRWNRPGHGLVPPDRFLPCAEFSDLICDIDTWVLRAAARQLADWNRVRGDRAMQISVNISGRHISQDRILADVAEVLSGDIIAPQLVLEVTETAPLQDAVAARNLTALRAMGIFVSLDDFGTGYQSSAQLSRLPIDVLKIDREFVDPSSPSSRSLLELMVGTAHAFGARVVAEGIETPEQLELVQDLGCEYAQGYYLGRPVAVEDLPPQDLDSLLAG